MSFYQFLLTTPLGFFLPLEYTFSILKSPIFVFSILILNLIIFTHWFLFYFLNLGSSKFKIPLNSRFECSFGPMPPVFRIIPAQLFKENPEDPWESKDQVKTYYMQRSISKFDVKVFSFESSLKDCRNDLDKLRERDLSKKLVKEDILLIAPIYYVFEVKNLVSGSSLSKEEMVQLLQDALLEKFEEDLTLKIDLDASVKEGILSRYSKEYAELGSQLKQTPHLESGQEIVLKEVVDSERPKPIFTLISSKEEAKACPFTDNAIQTYNSTQIPFSVRGLGSIPVKLSKKNLDSHSSTWIPSVEKPNQAITTSPTKLRVAFS